MTRAPAFAGLILAAGESSRMGRDKALLPWHGRTFLEAHINALQPHTDFVLVVAGKNLPDLQPLVYAAGAFLVLNPHAELGQFSSLQVGIQEILNRGRDAAIVSLVDRPPASPGTVSSLRQALERSEDRVWAVVSEYSGRHGHPIVVGREMMTAFLNAPPASNAREVEHAHQQHIEYVVVDDPSIVENVNTPDDYARITRE